MESGNNFSSLVTKKQKNELTFLRFRGKPFPALCVPAGLRFPWNVEKTIDKTVFHSSAQTRPYNLFLLIRDWILILSKGLRNFQKLQGVSKIQK